MNDGKRDAENEGRSGKQFGVCFSREENNFMEGRSVSFAKEMDVRLYEHMDFHNQIYKEIIKEDSEEDKEDEGMEMTECIDDCIASESEDGNGIPSQAKNDLSEEDMEMTDVVGGFVNEDRCDSVDKEDGGETGGECVEMNTTCSLIDNDKNVLCEQNEIETIENKREDSFEEEMVMTEAVGGLMETFNKSEEIYSDISIDRDKDNLHEDEDMVMTAVVSAFAEDGDIPEESNRPSETIPVQKSTEENKADIDEKQSTVRFSGTRRLSHIGSPIRIPKPKVRNSIGTPIRLFSPLRKSCSQPFSPFTNVSSFSKRKSPVSDQQECVSFINDVERPSAIDFMGSPNTFHTQGLEFMPQVDDAHPIEIVSLKDFLSLIGIRFLDNLASYSRRETFARPRESDLPNLSKIVFSLLISTYEHDIYDKGCTILENNIRTTQDQIEEYEKRFNYHPPNLYYELNNSKTGMVKKLKTTNRKLRDETLNELHLWRLNYIKPFHERTSREKVFLEGDLKEYQEKLERLRERKREIFAYKESLNVEINKLKKKKEIFSLTDWKKYNERVKEIENQRKEIQSNLKLIENLKASQNELMKELNCMQKTKEDHMGKIEFLTKEIESIEDISKLQIRYSSVKFHILSSLFQISICKVVGVSSTLEFDLDVVDWKVRMRIDFKNRTITNSENGENSMILKRSAILNSLVFGANSSFYDDFHSFFFNRVLNLFEIYFLEKEICILRLKYNLELIDDDHKHGMSLRITLVNPEKESKAVIKLSIRRNKNNSIYPHGDIYLDLISSYNNNIKENVLCDLSRHCGNNRLTMLVEKLSELV